MTSKTLTKNNRTLGRKIIIPATAIGYKSGHLVVTYVENTVQFEIGIGNDYTATLTMTIEAWQKLNNGEKLNFLTP